MYSITFTGSNTSILEYLARREDIHLSCCFFHKRSGDPSSFVTLCKVYDLPYKIISSNKAILSALETSGDVTLGISAGFEILSRAVYQWPKRGFVNIHSSYLPFYKGANPFYYQLLNNEKEGGVSIHQVTKGVDGGRIFCREKYPIYFEDDIFILIKRANRLAIQLLDEYLARILKGELDGIENVGGSYFPPVRKKQFIDLKMLPLQIYNLVRSQTIYGGCYLKFEDEILCVEKVLIRNKISDCSDIDWGAPPIVIGLNDEYDLILYVKKNTERHC